MEQLQRQDNFFEWRSCQNTIIGHNFGNFNGYTLIIQTGWDLCQYLGFMLLSG